MAWAQDVNGVWKAKKKFLPVRILLPHDLKKVLRNTVKTMALEITKSLIMAPEALGTSAGNSIQPLKTKIRARSLDVRAHQH